MCFFSTNYCIEIFLGKNINYITTKITIEVLCNLFKIKFIF